MEVIRSALVLYFPAILLSGKSTVAHADLVLVANSETRTWVERLGAARVEEMVDCGIPKELIGSVAKQRSDFETLKILWVGRLLPRKGVLLALEALAQLDHTLRFTCTIIGDGPQGRHLPRWIKQLGLTDRVVWKGELPWSEVLAAYLNHDVFLFTSLRDTSGTQLAEAMASGNAIVTLDHHGAKILVPENAGIKVPVNGPRETVAELARAIERLANEPTPANLEAVGAPTPIALIHGDATVVPPLGTTGMAIEHESVGLLHSVDLFVVGRLAPGRQRPPLEDGMDPPVAVGRQLGDDRLDLGHELVVR